MVIIKTMTGKPIRGLLWDDQECYALRLFVAMCALILIGGMLFFLVVENRVSATTLGGLDAPDALSAHSTADTRSDSDYITQPATPFPIREAQAMFRYAFEAIQERYIDAVSIADVALAGVNGLSTLDPDITIEHQETMVQVRTTAREYASLAVPAADDAAGWAWLTVAVTLASRAASPVVRMAESEQLYRAVLEPSLASLDDVSRYAGISQAHGNRAQRNGFGGIGIHYRPVTSGFLIVAVSPSSPAEQSGIVVGDVLTHVEGVPLAILEPNVAAERLRGPVNSRVTLSLYRQDMALLRTMTVTRALIVPETVHLALHDDMAVVKITAFNQHTGVSVREAIRQAQRQIGNRLRGIVLDLRGNPGGLLDQGISVSELFLPAGTIISTHGRHHDANQRYTASSGDIGEKNPLVVLVDGRSASAAEIVAAALQDNNRAVVVGTASYGKGTVQTLIPLPNDGEITLTWSRFHTPSGYALQSLGVLPSVCTHDLTARVETILAGMHTGDALPSHALLAAWRTAPLADTESRRLLRAHCPPASHEEAILDLEVARGLLADKTLYARALNLLPQMAAHP